jgi:hypothetical protein
MSKRRNKPRACCRCHVTKAFDRFPMGTKGVRRSAVCWTCTEEAAWAYYHRRIVTRVTWIDPETMQRVRRCSEPDCEAVKPLASDFYVMQHAGKLDSDGHRILTTRYARKCKACHDKMAAVAYRKRKADPRKRARMLKQRSAASKRWREKNLEHAKALGKAWKAKVKADPERHARYLEDTRINYRLRQARAGKPVKDGRWRAKRQATGPRRLPTEPLVRLIETTLDRREAMIDVVGDAGANLEAVCADLDVSSRTFRRWRKGEITEVNVGVAERVILAADVEWHDVYSYDDHADVFLAHEVHA